jgi:hypothetical protein
MSKYHKLVKFYAKQIAEIKALKAEYDGLVAKVNAIKPVLHPQPDWAALDEQEKLFSQAEEVWQILCICHEKLSMDIQIEYYDVPFKKPRDAGIEGFWRESGLQQLFNR